MKRYRLRDNIHNLETHRLARLSSSVQVDCVDEDIFEELRGVLRVTLEKLVRDAGIFATYER
jgi:hypothetical protein